MMGYRTEHFRLEELVPPDVFRGRGDAAWELLDPAALVSLDALRVHFGKAFVNDWLWDGNYQNSGFRASDTDVGALWSQHRYGRAFDVKFEQATPIEVFNYIRAHPEQFPHITTLEDVRFTTSWLHFDTRNNNLPGIRVVMPRQVVS